MSQIPAVRTDGKIPTLYVKNQPFQILGGEIHNSAASSPEYMMNEVWPRVKGLNLNTLIVPVYWELIEPEEGNFDFHTVDSLICQARENSMHLVFLWFGLWKNAESMYVPAWMKRDTDKYWRVQKVNGDRINTISPLCKEAVEKDALAFSRLMEHIRRTDEEESTVVMVQVENEIGILGSERDYSPEADRMFQQKIPHEIETLCNSTGTWKEVFQDNAEECFMAFYFASAVEKITDSGRKNYPLPCYTNAWLKQYPWYPGSYPSGGPVRNVHEIWKVVAPSLFTLAPDIYVPYVAQVMDEYAYEGNPLFIPEVRKDAVTASYCLYACMGKNAIGYAPFGIEELTLPPEKIDKPPMEVMAALNIDPSAFEIEGSKDYLAAVYDLVSQLRPIYLKLRGTEQLKSFVKKSQTDYGSFASFKNYDISVSYSPQIPAKPLASAAVFELEPGKFLVCGMMCSIEFRPKAGENVEIDYLKIEEGSFESGEWKPGRRLNGDEKMALKFGDMPSCLMIELYKY